MNWIKLREDLWTDPATLLVCEEFGVSDDEAVGIICRVLFWAGKHTTDGSLPSVTPALLDRVAKRDGMFSVLEKSGWVSQTDGGISFANWDRHNSGAAKERMLSAERSKRYRSKPDAKKPKKNRHGTVTVKRDASVTREEKRRIENSNEFSSAEKSEIEASFARLWGEYPRRMGANGKPKPPGSKKLARARWMACTASERSDVLGVALPLLIASGDVPADLERFLNPDRPGGKSWRDWMPDDTAKGKVVAFGNTTPNRAAGEYANDFSDMKIKRKGDT